MTPSAQHEPKGSDKASVADIPDADLLRRAVASARSKSWRNRQPRWSHVAARFSLGSTYAAQLCRRFGFDPDEVV